MPANFPDSPTLNQTYTYGAMTWQWTGSYWSVVESANYTAVTAITANLVPSVNEVYNLGSATLRWRDLYLSGNSLVLGAATISASGSAITLPANSSIGTTSFGSTSLTTQDLTVSGNLTVNGTTTTINSTTLSIDDKNIVLADGAANAAAADGAGITVAGASATLTYASASDTWNVNKNILITPGTANGVLYLNASKVATTGSALTFDGTTFQYTGAANFATSSGNVGIGTSSPGQKLQVNGVIYGNNSTNVAFLMQGSQYNGSIANTSTANTYSLGYTTDASTHTSVLYWNASGNLGLGVTPSAWGSARKAFQLNGGSVYATTAGDTVGVTQNAYNDGTGWKYVSNGYASSYYQNSGGHYFNIAGSGTAGNAITLTQAMALDASGNLSVNTTTARTKLFVASSNASDTITLGSVSGGFALSNLNTAYGTQFGSFSTGNGWIQVARMDGTPTAYNLCLQPSGGNVGIGGITNPVLTLHTVKDNASAYDPSIVAFNTISAIANRTSGALTNALAGFFTEVNGEWYIGGVTNSANTNSDFVFVGRNGGTRAEKLRITSAGDVAIGDTTASGYKLKVAGTANVTGALVVSSYAAVGSIVANDPGAGYYSYNNRIGGGLAVTGTLYNVGNLFANRFVLNQGSAGVTRTAGTVAAGWYRFAVSTNGGANSYGARGGCTFYMYTTGGWSGPGQTKIDLFKDYSYNGNLTVDTKGNYYFTNWRIAMDSNYAYLEGWTNGFSLGGDNTFNTIIDSYGWDSGGWTLYSETLTAGLSSPSYIIRASYINLNGIVYQRNHPSNAGYNGDDYVTVTGRTWESNFDNPVIDILTVTGSPVVYANLICEVEVWQTPWSNSTTGSIHSGYANWGNQGSIKNVTTMALKSSMPSGAHSNVGTLSWNGNTLRYTSNRASNYDHYNMRYTVRNQELPINYFY